MSAAKRGLLPIVQLLVERGADLNLKNQVSLYVLTI